MQSSDFIGCLLAAAAKMPSYEGELCLLDTKVGDGDHGVTIARGYRAVCEGVLAGQSPGAFCAQYGDVISAAMGGAIGPVYGLFFGALGKALGESAVVDARMLAEGFAQAARRVMLICRVKPGDKTVLDALLPASEALALSRDLPLSGALTAALAAAEDGLAATARMQAKKGRARYLAEQSVGHLDAGAASFTAWLRELTHAIASKEA